MIEKTLKPLKFKSLGARIVFFVLIFSSFFTFLTTSIQTYFDFNHSYKYLESEIDKHDSEYLKGLSYAIWTLDEIQTDVLLKSLFRMPEIAFIELKGPKGFSRELGKRMDSDFFKKTRKVDLTYKFLDQNEVLGKLYIEIDSSGVYKHSIESLGITLLSNGIKTFIVAFFMLFIFRRIVTTPLERLVEYTRALNGSSNNVETSQYSKGKNEIEVLSHSITELYKDLERSYSEASNREERFRDLVEFKQQTIWETDSDFIIKFSSLKNANEFIGKKIFDVYPFNIDPEKLSSKIQSEKIFRDFRYQFENECWEINAKPFYDERAKHINGYRFITRDRTENWHLENENEHNREKIRQVQKLDSIGLLASGLTHDFNNLLMIISGSLRNLKRGGFVKGEGSRYLDSAKSAVDRGSKITQKLMSFSREQSYNVNDENINNLLGDMFDLIEKCLSDKIELKVEMDKELFNTSIDASEFENACLNMAVNARDAMPDGGILHIKTSNTVKNNKNFIHISFSDTGEGMPKEVSSRIFEPFYTTKEVGKGTGLGLSQLYGFVNESDGLVEVESQEGLGTKISIFLPRV